MTKWLIVLMAVAAAAVAAEPAGNTQDSGTLSPGNTVYIDVHRRPELSTTAQIDSTGNVVLPEIGSVHVAGMTEQQASQVVADAFKRILRSPRVTVARNVTEVNMGFRKAEMQTELIPLQNAQAKTLSESLRDMTSDGGAISFDPDTNTLIVTDTPSAVKNIMNVVSRLDQMESQLMQVRIEAKIAEVKAGAMKELGVRWFVSDRKINAGYYPFPSQDLNINSIHGGTADPMNNETVGGAGNSFGSSGGRRFINEAKFDRRLNIPVQIPKAGQFFFGLMNSHIDIGALLDALIADNKAELLATPNILTVNHKLAEIKSTEEFPYTEFGVEFGRNTFATKFVDLGIVLKVTPHVLKDDQGTYVKLELEPEVSYPAGTANGVPIRAVRSSQTVTNVRDGQTLVIGGIYRNDSNNVQTRVPVVSKVPIVGNLFKHTEKVKSQTELMVFVTPTVHETPESVTWDRMLNVTTAGEVLNQAPARDRDTVRESRKE